MRISPVNNNLNFCKTLIGKAHVRRANGVVVPADVVEYHTNDRDDYRTMCYLEHQWKQDAEYFGQSEYIGEIAEKFITEAKGTDKRKYGAKFRFFALECKDIFRNDEVLAVAEVAEREDLLTDEPFKRISYIQTSPQHVFANRDKEYKGLGETLVAEIARIARDDGSDRIEIVSTNDKFWNSSSLFGYVEGDHPSSRVLDSEDFDKYISYVEKKKSLDCLA